MAVVGFAPRHGAYVAHLDETERDVLLDVVDQVVDLLGGVEAAEAAPFRLGAEPLSPPADPAVHRLLPDASKADAEVAAEFRRLTEPELRATKVTNLLRLRAVIARADPAMAVPPDAAPAVAAALTDVRLVLAERLGIRTDADAAALDGALATAIAAMESGGDDTSDDAPTESSPPTEDAAQPSSARGPAFAHLVFLASVYQLLGMLQDSLVELMLEGLPDADDPEPTARPR